MNPNARRCLMVKLVFAVLKIPVSKRDERPAKIATPATTSKKGVITAMLIIYYVVERL